MGDKRKYHFWKAKGSIVHGILISSVVDGLIGKLEQLHTTFAIWAF